MNHAEAPGNGGFLTVKEYESTSELLDDFYYERDRINRIKHRGHELIKLLNKVDTLDF